MTNKIDLLFNEAQTGNDDALDKFFNEIWEMISYIQGVDVSLFIDKVLWFKQNAIANRKGLAFALLTQGFLDFFRGQYASSTEFSNDAAKIFSELNYEDGVAMCATIKGTNYRTLGDIDLALKYVIEAFYQLHKTDKYLHFTIASGHQLAELYSETGNYPESLALFREVLELTQVSADKKKIFEPRLLNGMGSAYAKLGNFEAAFEYLDQALKKSEESDMPPVTARVLTDIGGYYFLQKDYSLAIDNNKRALAIREKLNFRSPMITNIINLADIYATQNKNDEAVGMLMKGLVIAEELKLRAKICQILNQLSKLYEQKEDLEKAFAFFKQYHNIKEEQNKEDMEKKAKNIKLIFDAEQTRKENEIIKAQKLEIEMEKKRSDDLLLNILPEEVAEELKNTGGAEAKYFSEVTVLFTDFKGFTTIAERLTPQELVNELHSCFKVFDNIMGKYGIEKIKTVGDAYLAVCGLPSADPGHAGQVINAAIEIRHFMDERKKKIGDMTFGIRIGVHSGSVVAGIVGVKKFAYDIWGDTVNTAARMEQNSEAGKINISETTYQLVKDQFDCICRGKIHAKNKGELAMYFVEGKKVNHCP